MNNIVYLLGAGASANAMPLTYEIPRHMRFMAQHVEKHISLEGSANYVNDINELLTHLNEFNTIDNYARVLSQNSNGDNPQMLKKMKSILCGLFMFEQLKKKNEIVNPYANVEQQEIEKMKRTVDLRYKSFFAKVLSKQKLDERIKILSWNYDMQVEIGLESNLGCDYDELQNSCSIYPHPSCELKKKNNYFYSWDDVSNVIKLNGTAGVFLKDSSFHNIYLNQRENFEDRFPVLLDVHKEISRYHNYNPFLKFAWERDEHSNRAVEYAKRIVSRANILVIVGYSFPDFNRPIDKEVFADNHIDEIFVQLPENDFENVKYNMRTSLGRLIDKCVHIRNLREFFIPSQFVPAY